VRPATRPPPKEPDFADHVEWGGPTWARQVAIGLDWLGDLHGCRVLEIGARFGGMSILFGLRGAEVVGVDTDAAALAVARERAARAHVEGRVTFEHRSGRPDDLPDGFDVVFCKSVLVIVPDQEAMLMALGSALVDEGRLLLIENARGPALLHAARMIRRGSLRPHGAAYFTPATLETIRRHFDVRLERWTMLPPTVVVGAVRHAAEIAER
jgi:SAM-dependent methyltransferase